MIERLELSNVLADGELGALDGISSSLLRRKGEAHSSSFDRIQFTIGYASR